MSDSTTEFSFILKPSDHGIGVFAVHDIRAETYLRLFADDSDLDAVSAVRNKEDVPEIFLKYCIYRGNTVVGPKDFGRMDIGWHLNHSKTPNAYHRNYDFYALRHINAGEEITIDYNTLEEPEEAIEDYYRQ
jgi:SET domain-containing protein